MKLVGWNCCMALHDKLPLLADLSPDVAVVPECANIATLRRKAPGSMPPSVAWIGDNPNNGLGVFGFGDFHVSLDPCYDATIHWIAPIRIEACSALTTTVVPLLRGRRANRPTIGVTALRTAPRSTLTTASCRTSGSLQSANSRWGLSTNGLARGTATTCR